MADDFFATLQPGDRIVVRYRLGAVPSGSGGPALTDALGDFAGLREGAVAVRTRTGAVEIALSSVTHAKRVPPPPARRRPLPSA